VVHELSKYGLAGIHPSLSAIGEESAAAVSSPRAPEKVEIEKSDLPPITLILSHLSR